MAVILGVLSFNGIEVIAVTSGEAKDPVRTIPAALRSMALRLFLFYILALTIVVTFVPWTETGATVVTQSPFRAHLCALGYSPCCRDHEFRGLERRAVEHEHQCVFVLAYAVFLSRGGFATVLGQARKERHPDHGNHGLRRLHPRRRRGLSKLTPLA